MGSSDVIVCGAGVIGCAVARELALRGASVTVVERGSPGQEASGAAAGMLTAGAYAVPGEPLAELCRESAALYPALVDALRAETGVDPHYSRCGSLRLAASAEDAAAMEDLARRQERAGWAVERVDGVRAADLAGAELRLPEGPMLSFPEEAVIDARELIRGLRVSAERRGARFVTGTPVTALRIESAVCTGVRTPGEDLAAGAVVDAAGSWAGLAGAAGFSVPIAPARGQIVELDSGSSRPARVLHRDHFYLAPREHGRLLAGSTIEFVGYEKVVTAAAVANLLRRAIELVPALAGSRFVGAWAGLRPAAPDGLPVLGATPLPGYFLAAGGFRNGVLMAPAVARRLSQAVLDENQTAVPGPFSMARFVRENEPVSAPNSALQREMRLGKIAER
ncbi:MAG TPA: glycine oxidase ThiO [Thermoanaerobaculia bacterium]|nr:glycine oxidase ThiO [Thermoanaerobaculia bacterium]